MSAQRRDATLLAALWQLELDAADDALMLPDQVVDQLLSQAAREHKDERFKQLSELDRAARRLRAAVLVLLDPPPGGVDAAELSELRVDVDALLPDRVAFSEILLEVCHWTNFADAFTHLSEGHEGRHSVARIIFHGNRGELRQPYREGQEDQLAALGFALNVLVLWNTQYMDDAVNHLRNTGHEISDEHLARLSPLQHEHVLMLGTFPFTLPHELAAGRRRQLRGGDGSA